MQQNYQKKKESSTLNQKRFVTSWDDGHPDDLRIAELLNKYNIPGIFYVPINNSEGRKVINAKQIYELDKICEVGAHTYSHTNLTTVSPQKAEEEILSGKTELEQILGREVKKFAYPHGAYNKTIKQIVKNAGFTSARIVRLFNVSNKSVNNLEIAPHFHFYNHPLYVYLGHVVKQRDITSLKKLPKLYDSELQKMISKTMAFFGNRTFHLWGHGWEVKEEGTFPILESIFKNYAHKTNS